MSSLAYECYRTTKETIAGMARDGVFAAMGTDTLRGVREQAVTGRFVVSPDRNNGGDQGESNIPLPGIVISHIRHSRPPTGGENSYDDGVIQQLIQIVDRIDDRDDSNAESYFRWQEDIREMLQINPYRRVVHPYGNVYYVHVSDQLAPGNDVFVLRQARLTLQVSLYTRSRINRDTLQHDN